MEFTLFYRGDLYGHKERRTGKEHKQELRSHFHKQLKLLWKNEPLNRATEVWNATFDSSEFTEGMTWETARYLIREVGPHHSRFVPLIVRAYKVLAELNITILRPGKPGSIVHSGGDIDNQLKTLFDALTMPNKNQLPQGWTPGDDETPFFCLLENDNLISSVRVSTARLLDEPKENEVALFIRVVTRLITPTGNNWFLA